jgi:hypothetical protein
MTTCAALWPLCQHVARKDSTQGIPKEFGGWNDFCIKLGRTGTLIKIKEQD